MEKQQIVGLNDVRNFIMKNLELKVVTTSNYTGGMGTSGDMYEKSHTIQLLFEGEVISEEFLD